MPASMAPVELVISTRRLKPLPRDRLGRFMPTV
jgi:hypothetical protein